MELYGGNGTLLLANDIWKDSRQAPIQATGLKPGERSRTGDPHDLDPG